MFATWKKNNKFLELEQLSKPYKLTQAYTKSILKRKQADDLFPIDGIPAKIANGSATPVMCTPTTPPYTGTYGETAIQTLKNQQNPAWESSQISKEYKSSLF
jgi:hypothetical protein